MGNSYSVAREEQEEEEFLRLVEAVEIAQQRSNVRPDDTEAGLVKRKRKPVQAVPRNDAHPTTFAHMPGPVRVPALPPVTNGPRRMFSAHSDPDRTWDPVSDAAGAPASPVQQAPHPIVIIPPPNYPITPNAGAVPPGSFTPPTRPVIQYPVNMTPVAGLPQTATIPVILDSDSDSDIIPPRISYSDTTYESLYSEPALPVNAAPRPSDVPLHPTPSQTQYQVGLIIAAPTQPTAIRHDAESVDIVPPSVIYIDMGESISDNNSDLLHAPDTVPGPRLVQQIEAARSPTRASSHVVSPQSEEALPTGIPVFVRADEDIGGGFENDANDTGIARDDNADEQGSLERFRDLFYRSGQVASSRSSSSSMHEREKITLSREASPEPAQRPSEGTPGAGTADGSCTGVDGPSVPTWRRDSEGETQSQVPSSAVQMGIPRMRMGILYSRRPEEQLDPIVRAHSPVPFEPDDRCHYTRRRSPDPTFMHVSEPSGSRSPSHRCAQSPSRSLSRSRSRSPRSRSSRRSDSLEGNGTLWARIPMGSKLPSPRLDRERRPRSTSQSPERQSRQSSSSPPRPIRLYPIAAATESGEIDVRGRQGGSPVTNDDDYPIIPPPFPQERESRSRSPEPLIVPQGAYAGWVHRTRETAGRVASHYVVHEEPESAANPQPVVINVGSREPSPCSSPVPIIIQPPPTQFAPHHPSSFRPSPRDAHSPTELQFERLLTLHERSISDWERHARLWHEQSTQFAKVVQGLEKQLILLRHGVSVESFDYLDDDEKFSQVRPHEDAGDEKATMGAMGVQSLAYVGRPKGMSAKPYPSRPYAAGLRAVRRCSDDWSPAWDVFPLKAFRGSGFLYLKIQSDWDDADLLRELSRSYDKLRTVWRKWFSLRSVRSITMVYADHTFVYPRRVGPAGVSPSKNMRLRYFLRHPEQMKGRHEFMQVLTARTDLGIEFVEGWQLTRIAIAILLPVIASLFLAVFYSVFASDVSDAFTIAGYMTSAYSVCLVLLGVLNFVEF